jgi:hypothetical protein
MKLRLLKQEDGTFTFREMLSGVHVLHDSASAVSGKAVGEVQWQC